MGRRGRDEVVKSQNCRGRPTNRTIMKITEVLPKEQEDSATTGAHGN